jgi:hypothetical protein
MASSPLSSNRKAALGTIGPMRGSGKSKYEPPFPEENGGVRLWSINFVS